MQHILFSVISAIIGINFLVASRAQSTETPTFEHYDVEAIVAIDTTPQPYTAFLTPSIALPKEQAVESQVESELITQNPSPIPVARESATPTITIIETTSPTLSATETLTLTPSISPSPTPYPSITLTVSPTPTLMKTFDEPVLIQISPTGDPCGTIYSKPPFLERPTICL